MICAACGFTRDPHDLLAFWPVGSPDRRRFVCRPTRPVNEAMQSCFARSVGVRDIHSIELAAPPIRLLEASSPIRPDTPAWIALLSSAGVRAA